MPALPLPPSQATIFRLFDISRGNVVSLTIYCAHRILCCLYIVMLHGKHQRTIPEYWIVNPNGRRVEALTDPDPPARRYGQETLAYEGKRLSLPGGRTVAVSNILPPL